MQGECLLTPGGPTRPQYVQHEFPSVTSGLHSMHHRDAAGASYLTAQDGAPAFSQCSICRRQLHFEVCNGGLPCSASSHTTVVGCPGVSRLQLRANTVP